MCTLWFMQSTYEIYSAWIVSSSTCFQKEEKWAIIRHYYDIVSGHPPPPHTQWVLLSCFCNCKEITMPLVLTEHGNENFIFISNFMGMNSFFATSMYILFTYVWATFSISDVPHHYYPIIKPTLGDFQNICIDNKCVSITSLICRFQGAI